MNIVIEGCDASGKSTLARVLSRELRRRVYHSDGPEKYEGEMNERAIEFMRRDNAIFDRHPCVGEYIYYILREKPPTLEVQLTANFYKMDNLFLYCRAPEWFEHHQVREGESEEHIKQIRTNQALIQSRYDLWAYEHSHILVRPDTDRNLVLAMIKGALKHA